MMQTGVDRAAYSKMVEQRPSMFTNEGTGEVCYIDEWSLEPSDHDLNIKNCALTIWKVRG